MSWGSAPVQKTIVSFSDSVTTFTGSLGGTTAGNLLVLTMTKSSGADNNNPALAIPTPTGWTAAIAPTGAPGGGEWHATTAIFYKISTGGTQTATISSIIESYLDWQISEYAATGTIALGPIASGNLSSGSSALSLAIGPTSVPSVASGLVIAIGQGGASNLLNPTTGYTNLGIEPDDSAHTAYSAGYKVITSAAAQSATWNWSVANTTTGAAGCIAIFTESGGGGGDDVSVALTGTAATGSAGAVGPGFTKGITGSAATGAAGSVAPGTAKALTGNAGAASAGSVGASLTIGLTGVAASGAAGNVTASAGSDVTVGLSGVQAAGQVGTMSPAIAKGVTGVACTAAVGSVSSGVAKALSGNAAAGSVGSVTAQASGGNVTIGLTGVQASATVGNVAPSGGVAVGSRIGFEIGGRGARNYSFKPLLQRVLEAKAPRVKPEKERAQKRAKAIEVQGAELALNGTATESKLRELTALWIAERPVMPPMLMQVDPLAVYLAQVAFRIRQRQGEQQLLEAIAAKRRKDDDEAALVLLLA